MDVKPTLEADARFAEGGKPCMGALDYPTMMPEPLLALDAFSGDAWRNATLFQVPQAPTAVIGFVGAQFSGALARAASQPWHGSDGFAHRNGESLGMPTTGTSLNPGALPCAKRGTISSLPRSV